MNLRRVVVTGLGCVCPLGASTAELWASLRACRYGMRTLEQFGEFPASVFAPVTVASSVLVGDMDVSVRRNLTRPMEMMFAVVREALAQARLLDHGPSFRIGLIAGTTANYPVEMENPEDLLRYYDCSQDGQIDWPRFQRTHGYPPNRMLRHMTNLLTCVPAIHFRLRGINETVHNACASGTQSVGAAFRLVKHGYADVILAGGAEALVNWPGVTALGKLGVLSPQKDASKACRPFDSERDGLVLGEGAAVLTVESLESAERRGVPILAEILGFGSTSNAYRITDSPVDGIAASSAITHALKEAQVAPEELDAISAHATSTPQNDLAEANAIKLALGPAARRVPTMALKALLGHSLSAAGAVELVAAVHTLQTGFLPPVPAYRTPDPECGLAVVGPDPAEAKVTHLLKNSFGFGGQNAALVLKRWPAGPLAGGGILQ